MILGDCCTRSASSFFQFSAFILDGSFPKGRCPRCNISGGNWKKCASFFGEPKVDGFLQGAETLSGMGQRVRARGDAHERADYMTEKFAGEKEDGYDKMFGE